MVTAFLYQVTSGYCGSFITSDFALVAVLWSSDVVCRLSMLGAVFLDRRLHCLLTVHIVCRLETSVRLVHVSLDNLHSSCALLEFSLILGLQLYFSLAK